MKAGHLLLILLGMSSPLLGFDSDSFSMGGGNSLKITFVGHGTLMLQTENTVIHIDPVGREADYATMPKGDIILVTHEHSDHLDVDAIREVSKSGTVVVANPASAVEIAGSRAMRNGETGEEKGITIQAVPAYNTTPGRVKYHPRGRDNGYVLSVGDLRIYVAGDSENIPEMGALKDIDIAFLPVNQPYTMTPEQAAAAAKSFRPKVLYPYHLGETDPELLKKLLAGEPDIEVRIRSMQ